MAKGGEGEIRDFEMRTIGNVEPDRGDGRSGRKSDRTSKTRQAEDETQRTCKPHWSQQGKAKKKKTLVSAFSALFSFPIWGKGERTNPYELGNANVGQLCGKTWNLVLRRPD